MRHYTTQLCGDYTKRTYYKDPVIKQPVFHGFRMPRRVFLTVGSMGVFKGLTNRRIYVGHRSGGCFGGVTTVTVLFVRNLFFFFTTSEWQESTRPFIGVISPYLQQKWWKSHKHHPPGDSSRDLLIPLVGGHFTLERVTF